RGDMAISLKIGGYLQKNNTLTGATGRCRATVARARARLAAAAWWIGSSPFRMPAPRIEVLCKGLSNLIARPLDGSATAFAFPARHRRISLSVLCPQFLKTIGFQHSRVIPNGGRQGSDSSSPAKNTLRAAA